MHASLKNILGKSLLPLALLTALAHAQFVGGVAPVNGSINASGASCTSLSMDSTNSGPSNCVSMPLPSQAATASMVVSGTFTATVAFELTADRGHTWVSVSSVTVAGTTTFGVNGYNGVRARASAYTSGQASVTINIGVGVGGTTVISQSGAPVGNCTSTNSFYVNVSNGNLYTCPVAAAAYVLTGTGGSPPGNVSYMSNPAFGGNLATAIASLASGGVLYIDQSVSVSATVTVATAGVTLQCVSLTPVVSFTTTGRILFNAPNSAILGCNLQGPDMATVGGGPIVFGNAADASNSRFIGNSFNGWGSTSSNGVVVFSLGSHFEAGSNRAGDLATGSSCTVSTASWAQPVSGTIFGAETITFAASGLCASAFPTDFAVGNGLACSAMSPLGYNKPGDGQTSFFGQIITSVYPSVTVQQIYNPGTYVSGGTCQSGIGNGDVDLFFHVNGSAGTQIQSDWNAHDNDVGTILAHNDACGATVDGYSLTNNKLHPGQSNGYYWGSEIGPFQGALCSTPFAFHNVTVTANDCRIAADTGNGVMQGCYSQSGTEETRETGNGCNGGGHVINTQCDENAAVEHLTSSGNELNMLGNGPGEDLNRVNDSTVTGSHLFYPSPSGSFMVMSVASGGVGTGSKSSTSYNTIEANTFKASVDIGPTVATGSPANACGAQILNAVGSAGTVTVTFLAGVVNPGLAVGQSIVVVGNSIAGGCSGSTLNNTLTIATVIGSGTGFTVTNASINGATCTGGKATSSGLNNPAGTTDVATFEICPHPFKVGDTIAINNAAVAGYNTAAPSVTTVAAITEQAPCTVSYALGSGLAQSGSTPAVRAYAGNYNGIFVQMQLNIANGGSIDHNKITGNHFEGSGVGLQAGAVWNMSNNGTTASMDLNEWTHNSVFGVFDVFSMGGSGSLGETNVKYELGSTASFTNMFRQWTNNSTVADDSTNPQSLTFTGTGVGTASSTLFLYPTNFGTGTVPLTTLTATSEGDWYVAKHAYTMQGLFCTSTAVGVSGVVTARVNKVNRSPTCSLLGVTTCNDTTHSLTGAQGDLISVQVATGVADTLANVQCKLYLWYQGN